MDRPVYDQSRDLPGMPHAEHVRSRVHDLVMSVDRSEREGIIKSLLETERIYTGPIAGGGKLRPPPSTAPIERVTVHTALDQQQNNIGDLHNQLQELEARLHTMLQHPPVDGCGQSGAMPAPVQIVDRLIMHNQGIRAACSIVQQLLARVDL